MSAAIGLTVALTMLLTTVQLAARLHRTSAMAAVASDAVHAVAEAPSAAAGEAARRQAEAAVRARFGPEARIRWSDTPDSRAVDILVPGPHLPGLSPTIHRGAVARIEQPS